MSAAIPLSCCHLCSCLQAQPVQQGARCKPGTSAHCCGGGSHLPGGTWEFSWAAFQSLNNAVENFSITWFISDVPSLNVKSGNTAVFYVFFFNCLNNCNGYLLAAVDLDCAVFAYMETISPFFFPHTAETDCSLKGICNYKGITKDLGYTTILSYCHKLLGLASQKSWENDILKALLLELRCNFKPVLHRWSQDEPLALFSCLCSIVPSEERNN